MNGFEIIGFIGEGRYSSTFKVRKNDDKQIFALKKLKFESNEQEIKTIYQKFQKLSHLDHPNIIKYHDIVYDEKGKCFCVLMEWADKGDLQIFFNEHLQLKQSVDEEQLWIIFFQILKALKSLHTMKIYHKNLKLSNIFFNSKGNIKIGDINIIDNHEYINFAIPANYRSPEFWDNLNYTDKCDIWSFGCIMYELSNLKPAFRGENLEELKKKILRCYYSKINKEYSTDFHALIENLLNIDSKKRPNSSQLLELDFIIRNFNKLVEKNALNKGISLPQIKHIYANNPFAKKGDKTQKNSKIRPNKREKFEIYSKNQEKLQKADNNELEKKNISKIYEKIDLSFFAKENLATNRKPYYLNQIMARKMKGSLEKIKQRKKDDFLKMTEYNPFPFENAKDILISPRNIQRISQKILKKSSKKQQNNTEKSFSKPQQKITNNENHINESHLIDLNQEIRFPEIEQSKIFSIKPPSDSFVTERANSFVDKRFTTRNLSYNQWMMNKIKQENIEITENRIISLKEIHQKYILNN